MQRVALCALHAQCCRLRIVGCELRVALVHGSSDAAFLTRTAACCVSAEAEKRSEDHAQKPARAAPRYPTVSLDPPAPGYSQYRAPGYSQYRAPGVTVRIHPGVAIRHRKMAAWHNRACNITSSTSRARCNARHATSTTRANWRVRVRRETHAPRRAAADAARVPAPPAACAPAGAGTGCKHDPRGSIRIHRSHRLRCRGGRVSAIRALGFRAERLGQDLAMVTPHIHADMMLCNVRTDYARVCGCVCACGRECVSACLRPCS